MSRPSGAEQVGRDKQVNTELTTRRRAAAAGRAAERFVSAAVDRLESVSLWALEQTADTHPTTDHARTAEQRLNTLRSAAAPLPRTAGRLVAGATYVGFRSAPELTRLAREILRDTSAFLNAEPEAQKD